MAAVGAMTGALLLAGCGTIAEQVAEEAVEQAAGGGELDINADDGEISFENEEGSFSLGGDGELPEGFPDELPVPGDLSVLSSMGGNSDGDSSFVVNGQVSGDLTATYEDLRGQLEDGGFSVDNESTFSSGDQETRSMQFEGNGWRGAVSVATGPEGETVVTYTVQSHSAS